MLKGINNIKIGTRLIGGFVLIICFSIVLGLFTYSQTKVLRNQTETMYNHPLQIRRAISTLEQDILKMELAMSRYDHTGEELSIENLATIEEARLDAMNQFEIMEAQYLGPSEDVDNIINEYTNWIILQDKVIEEGYSQEYISELERSITNLNVHIQTLDEFARNKADELYLTSQNVSNDLRAQLTIIIALMIVFSIGIGLYLNSIINKPLLMLGETARDFKNGKMDARVDYSFNNEFGELTGHFNKMINSIEENLNLEDKKSNLSEIMVNEDDANSFFEKTLHFLAKVTDSQAASIYHLSEDGSEYLPAYSIGLKEDAMEVITFKDMTKELNKLEKDEKVYRIKEIPEDTQFTSYTVFGEFMPKEIISVPITYMGKTRALISLASIYSYSDSSVDFIEGSIDAIAARVESILAYKKIKEVSNNLEMQNRELDIQRNEMEVQAKELKAQNIELEVQKKQLNEANMLKTNFLSNMSHELRTPLNSVIALAGVLYRKLDGTIPAKEHSYLEVIERNGKNLLLLINDILDISRIEAGREEYNINKFNMNELIKDLVTMIEPQARGKFIGLQHLNNDNEIYITSDDGKIRHIVQNLLSNAIKFTETGKVVVEVKEEADNIRISVKDTGIGMTTKQMGHIFDEFRQADGSTSRRYGGTGLGLSIAKRYSNLLGGDIFVESVPDVGSTFTVTLPYEFNMDKEIISTKKRDALMTPKTSAEAVSKVDVKTSEVALETKSIMLVEDNVHIVLQLQELLNEEGYELEVANNGKVALDKIAIHRPDGLVLDLMMPDVDGFEVLKVLRSNPFTEELPILVLTAKQITEEDAIFLTDHNIHQLIQKGDINKRELLDTVRAMLFPESPIISNVGIMDKSVNTDKSETEKGTETTEKYTMADRLDKSNDDLKRLQILVVEDNPDNMITVKALLEHEYDVVEAFDGFEGVEMAKVHQPDLILMDIALPGIDGIEAFKRIRNNPRLINIPILALTASAMVQDKEAILAYGFDAFISKPIIEKEFYGKLKGVLYGV